MMLKQTLLELGRHHRAALSVRDRADFEDELDRLRMMRLAEEGLGLGDLLPDFALEDVAGRVWTSGELLDHGPLVLALFRGDWCPYCDLTMVALEKARPAIEALGAMAVGILPDGREHIASTVARRGLGYLLLSDPANAFSRTCAISPPHAWQRSILPTWSTKPGSPCRSRARTAHPTSSARGTTRSVKAGRRAPIATCCTASS